MTVRDLGRWRRTWIWMGGMGNPKMGGRPTSNRNGVRWTDWTDYRICLYTVHEVQYPKQVREVLGTRRASARQSAST